MLGEVCYNHIFYADDLCLLAPCAITLQKWLDICHEYGVEHDVIYNPLKSVCIVFQPDHFYLKCPLVHLGNNVLEYQEKVKYLGVLLNDKLNDNDDIMKQMRGLYMLVRTQSWESLLHALLKSNLDCFKLFAQVSIVLICGINLPNRLCDLCPRSEWHIIMFSGFYLDIEEVAAPAKCLSPMIYITLKVVCENILMILLCELAAAVMS